MPIDVNFSVVLRGYDCSEVDAVVLRVSAALESKDVSARATVRQDLRDCAFPVRLRGYDRLQVDEYLRQAASQLA